MDDGVGDLLPRGSGHFFPGAPGSNPLALILVTAFPFPHFVIRLSRSALPSSPVAFSLVNFALSCIPLCFFEVHLSHPRPGPPSLKPWGLGASPH